MRDPKEYSISEWSYRSIKGIFKGILRLSYGVKSQGLHHIDDLDASKGFVLAANHGSIVDAFVMGLEVESHKVRFVGRQRTLWSNPVFGKINDIVGTIPVPERREAGKSVVIEASVSALRKGSCVGIFPEGAILTKRKRFEGKSGTARMALEAGSPIIPMGILGTDGLWPYGAKMPRLGRHVKLFVGEPLYFDDYHGMHEDRVVVRYVTDRIMKEIRSESGWYDVPSQYIIQLHQQYEKLSKPVV
ncbi:MAG: 1-acyl-sn-glycerol-3-phosphate acyltransferase [Candidatus Heimdallarchaeota archaeon]|nr:1-acyl-sn-glycerol-3-phosphate acyltransferase [Candidatus Heimdallarchaeota archaeon]